MNEDLLKQVHVASSKHRDAVLGSERCACFYCLRSFAPATIREWTDDGATAICPLCGIDSVLPTTAGFELSSALLDAMHAYWFERTVHISDVDEDDSDS